MRKKKNMGGMTISSAPTSKKQKSAAATKQAPVSKKNSTATTAGSAGKKMNTSKVKMSGAVKQPTQRPGGIKIGMTGGPGAPKKAPRRPTGGRAAPAVPGRQPRRTATSTARKQSRRPASVRRSMGRR